MQIFFFPVSPTERLPLTISGADPEGGAPGARPPPKIGKNTIFWRFFTRNTPKIFAPPSARPNFLKCAPPLTWNPGSAPVYD